MTRRPNFNLIQAMGTGVVLLAGLWLSARPAAGQQPTQAATQPSPKGAQAQPSIPGSTVKFAVNKNLPKPVVGQPYAYSLCSGESLKVKSKDLTPSLDADLCEDPSSTLRDVSSGMISGGSPPYHFQMEPGSFLPLGLHLGLNGTVYGTPLKPPRFAQPSPTICAVDVGGNPACQTVSIPAVTGGSQTGKIVAASGLAVGSAVAVGLLLGDALKDSANDPSGGGTVNGQCTDSSLNPSCSPCTCPSGYGPTGTNGLSCSNSSQCGSGGSCFIPTAPFCG